MVLDIGAQTGLKLTQYRDPIKPGFHLRRDQGPASFQFPLSSGSTVRWSAATTARSPSSTVPSRLSRWRFITGNVTTGDSFRVKRFEHSYLGFKKACQLNLLVSHQAAAGQTSEQKSDSYNELPIFRKIVNLRVT